MRIGTFDIETDGLLDKATRVWCGCIKDHADGMVHSYGPDAIMDMLHALEKYDVLIGHNCISFDFPVLRKLYGWNYHGKKVDTLLMSRTQRSYRRAPPGCEAGPHSVEAWGLRLGDFKLEHEDWSRYYEAMLRRCQQDVEVQYKIYVALLEEGRGEGWANAHRLNNVLFDRLQQQAEYGWKVDVDLLEHYIRTLNRWIARIDRAVHPRLPLVTEKGNEFKKPFKKDGTLTEFVQRYVLAHPCIDPSSISGPFSRVDFRPVDLASTKEVKEYLLSLGWEPKEYNTNEDGETTSPKFSHTDPFEGVQGSLGRLIAKRVQCTQRRSTLTGWKERVRPDGCLTAEVAGIAATGRLRHKNIVNVPSTVAFFGRQMRSIFVPRDGMVMVGCDSKGNQVRQLAARMGSPKFTEAVLKDKERDGTDFHEYNRELCGGIPRTRAKNFFYGFIFGAQPPRIAKEIGVTLKEAEDLVSMYLDSLPELAVLIHNLTAEWRKTARKSMTRWGKLRYYGGTIKGLDGRPVLVEKEHTVLCYTLQSDEAIQMAAAYCKIYMECEKRGWEWGKDWGMLIWMHDEFQMESKPELAEELGQIASDAIKWAGQYYFIGCPHEGEAKIGRNWYETH